MLDNLLTDVEACLDEYQIAADRLELLQSLILCRDEMGLTPEKASRYAAMLVKDSLGWLDACRDLLHPYPAAIAKELATRSGKGNSVTAGKSSQG